MSIIKQIAAVVPTVQTNSAPDPNSQWSIKAQTYTTDKGGIPVTGFPNADYRGNDPTSAIQDEHHTFAEHKGPSDIEVQAAIIGLPIVNEKLYGASPAQVVAILEEHLPSTLSGFINTVAGSLGGFPSLRVLLVDSHG